MVGKSSKFKLQISRLTLPEHVLYSSIHKDFRTQMPCEVSFFKSEKKILKKNRQDQNWRCLFLAIQTFFSKIKLK